MSKHPESPVTYGDLLKLKEEIREMIGSRKVEYMDIREAQEYTGRSQGTIRKHCRIAKKGYNGKHLYLVTELEEIK